MPGLFPGWPRFARRSPRRSFLQIPDNARNLERQPLEFEEEDHIYLTSDPKRSPGMMVEDQGEQLRDLTDVQDRRLSDDVRSDEGECNFVLGQALRVTLVPQQRADPGLAQIFRARPMLPGFRLAPDGLLEPEVPLPPPTHSARVPVVPGGSAMGNLLWKRWLFLQFHVGILGRIAVRPRPLCLCSGKSGGRKCKLALPNTLINV